MDVAVYGGSFNPPHVGHGMVAAWLLWTRRVDSVLLVPAFAHAFDKVLRPFEERVALCEALASELGPSVSVSRIEGELPSPSYTIETLEHLSEQLPENRLRLVVGADVLEQTHLWRDWDRILERFMPIVVGRGGYPPVDGTPTFPEVSSSDIRRRLAGGQPIEHLVPGRVLDLLEGSRRVG